MAYSLQLQPTATTYQLLIPSTRRRTAAHSPVPGRGRSAARDPGWGRGRGLVVVWLRGLCGVVFVVWVQVMRAGDAEHRRGKKNGGTGRAGTRRKRESEVRLGNAKWEKVKGAGEESSGRVSTLTYGYGTHRYGTAMATVYTVRTRTDGYLCYQYTQQTMLH